MTQSDISSIADLYRTSAHEPEHPSYRAFVNDTLQQWRNLLNAGWQLTRVTENPYASSAELFSDIARKQLKVFTGGNAFETSHPLEASIPRCDWTVNEVFRAVHDILGHGLTRTPFETFEGEIEAYRNHARQYSLEAIPALFGETVGQLCHYYAGFGFVDVQRAVILPSEVLDTHA